MFVAFTANLRYYCCMAKGRRPQVAVRLRKTKKKKVRNSQRPKFIISLIISLVIMVFGLLLYDAMTVDLPSLQQLENFNPNLVTRIYSADSVLIHELFAERRVLVPLYQIPQHTKDAFIATEDIRFWDHWGISSRDIARAVAVDIMTLSKKQGASTLTQQLARVLYLNMEKRITRKLKEMITAIQIERTYTKEEILEMYLNSIYLGHGAYGVQAATRRLFDKKVQELMLEESAMLAALPKSPGGYSPIFNPRKALSRRNLVLRLMKDQGKITLGEYITARAKPIVVQRRLNVGGYAPYFTENVRQELNKISTEYGFDVLRDGLTIYTTLDSRIQFAAEKAVRDHILGVRSEADSLIPDWALGQQGVLNKRLLENPDELIDLVDTSKYSLSSVDSMIRGEIPVASELRSKLIVQTALVAKDPSTGHILAMVGGRNFRLDKFNRATQAKRQPGSVFKPIVWTAALDNGYLTSDMLLNQPVVLFMDDSTRWRPRNYDGSTGGLVDLRQALQRSLNLVSVRMVQELITPGTVRDYAKAMGFTTNIRPVQAIALGTSELIPIEVVSAFATFANKGVWVAPIIIRKVEDRFGNLILENIPERKEILSEETAYLMTDLLESVVKNGTGISSRWKYKFYMDAGGKTGTTNDYTDAWFVGFTPLISAGVWVGMDDPQVSLGDGQAGSVAALPIWANFMKALYDTLDWPDVPFERPENVVELEICSVTGKNPTPYCPIKTEIYNKKYVPEGICPIHTGAIDKKKGKIDF